jgi:hypothetical protein
MLQRHSSRRNRLDQSVLTQRLAGAVSYDRIAGYFRSSLFEVAGEVLASVTGPVRIICNSDLDPPRPDYRSGRSGGVAPELLISLAARLLFRTLSGSFRARSLNPQTCRLSAIRRWLLPLPLLKPLYIAANKGCGRTRSISPAWRWNDIGWAVRGWCWPIPVVARSSFLLPSHYCNSGRTN